MHMQIQKQPLDDSQLGSCNVQRINVSSQPCESLLRAVGTDEGVDLDGGHVILLLESGSNLALVGLDIDDEHEGVVLLNLLHGGFGVERVDEDLAGVETRLRGDRFAGILGRAATIFCQRLLQPNIVCRTIQDNGLTLRGGNGMNNSREL
jgi:hypothetical protein